MEDQTILEILKDWSAIGASVATIFSISYLTIQSIKIRTNLFKKIYISDMNSRIGDGYLLNPNDKENSFTKAIFEYNFSITNTFNQGLKINRIIIYIKNQNKIFTYLGIVKLEDTFWIKGNDSIEIKFNQKYPMIIHQLFKKKQLKYHFDLILTLSYSIKNKDFYIEIPLGFIQFETLFDFTGNYRRKDEYIYKISRTIYNMDYYNIHFFTNKSKSLIKYKYYLNNPKSILKFKHKIKGWIAYKLEPKFKIKFPEAYQNKVHKQSDNPFKS